MAKAKKTTQKKEAKPKAAKPPKAEKPPKAPKVKEVPAVDLSALRKPVDEAKTALATAEAEAHELTEKAKGILAGAKEAYHQALTPYREACRKAKVPCEFEGGRGANVAEKVTFLVEKVDKGVRVTVKGRPDTEEVIPMAALKESVNREAYRYTDAHVGPREKVGNKGGSLSNRLRAVLR